MASQGPSLNYRRLRAPRHDGGKLLEPGWEQCKELPARNRQRLQECDFELSGRSFHALRQQFQEELLSRAKAYTSHYAPDEIAESFRDGSTEQPIIMTGHQPRLFHPGVWAKNFAVADLAGEVNGIPINVIIDNDTMREPVLRIPAGTKKSPRIVVEPFDRFADPIPFESRDLIDRELLESFPARVVDQISNIIPNPLVTEIWPDVLSAVDRGKPLGSAFAEARHKLELRWGLRTLDVPLSQLCAAEPFRWFVFSMLLNGDALAASYNRRLQEYRDVHRLRSAAQPLPNLRSKDGWNESPFWLLSEDKTRRSLWWQRQGYDLLLSDDRLEKSWTIPNAMSTPEKGFDAFQELCDSKLSVRPRALTNTMLLRLFGCEVFVHGIGGAKYDQVTDLVLHDMCGGTNNFVAPDFIALSKTVLLPTGEELITDADCVRQREHLREIFFHPERFLSEPSKQNRQVSCIVENKLNWIRQNLPRGERGERHRNIVEANAKLRQFLQEKTEFLEKTLAETESRLGASKILGSREWSFCLFPSENLRERLLESETATT